MVSDEMAQFQMLIVESVEWCGRGPQGTVFWCFGWWRMELFECSFFRDVCPHYIWGYKTCYNLTWV